MASAAKGEVDKLKNAVLSGLRQVAGLRLALGILAMAALVFVASVDPLVRQFREMSVLPYGYHTEFVLTALRSDTVAAFVPILAVLPFAGSFVDDVKSKFARFFLIRSSFPTYLVSRILVCFITGGFVAAAGALLSWGGAALLFAPMEGMEAYSDVSGDLWQTVGLLFLAGGLWAVAGMAMSTLMESKYIAYASPFVLYYLLVILYERYFPNAYLIYPREWMNPSGLWPFGGWGPGILMAELTLVFALIFVFRAGRRLMEL